MSNDMKPHMSQVTTKCAAWRTLPLTPVGRVNLLKMVYLPTFLYFFRNTPSHLPKSFFKRLEGLLVSFVWARKPSRVSKRILYLPLMGGGLALPNLLLGSSPFHHSLVVFPAQKKPSGYIRSSHPGVICSFEQTSISRDAG